MKDRIPSEPGRVLITPENGNSGFYARMERADNPTQFGDPLNKSTLLKDDIAALFGFDNSAVPDDIFSSIGSSQQVFSGYASDLYQFITGTHLLVRLSAANNYNTMAFERAYSQMKDKLERQIDISDSPDTITVYDGGKL